ncbi:MAG: cache domain-containing protein, partial [Mariprofundaceae bacterium]|nr:cache domain-containing protein [Mariprofundaceae bacterium]
MTDISLKRRIFLPLGFTAVMLFLLSVYSIYQLENRHWQEYTSHSGTMLEHNQMMLQHQMIELMTSLSGNIAGNKQIIDAFKARNRDELLRLCTPLFKKMQASNGITHFYFHDAGITNVLRIHEPNRSGDLIKRQTAQQAMQTRALSYGLELGPLGTFTLRLVRPVFEDGKLLGFVELGVEMSYLLAEIEHMMDWKLIML